MAYFPMFIELDNKKCLIVGGGEVAYRKAIVLNDFNADITIIAPCINDKIKNLFGITYIEKEFENNDLLDKFLVVAATDDEVLNHSIACLCNQRNIHINAVDQIQDCGFIFPSYIKEEDVVAAFSSGGNSPVVTQYLKRECKTIVTKHIGKLANFLGSIRPIVKEACQSEKERKNVYKYLLNYGIKNNVIPSNEQVEKTLDIYKER